jgi:hypothetical protein
MLKPLLSIIAVLILTSNIIYAQNFIADYHSYILKRYSTVNDSVKKRVKKVTDRLDLTLRRFEAEQGHPFITGDTVFLINFYEMETSFPSLIIWNGSESCYYKYTYELVHWKVKHKTLTILTDASNYIDNLKPAFKELVRRADTASFTRYADKNRMLDGSAVSFTRAILQHSRWVFMSSNSYTTYVYKDFN